jgi:hypothetical protein
LCRAGGPRGEAGVAVPITSIRFGTTWDIHLLRGQHTGSLRERLVVVDAEDGESRSLQEYGALHDDLKVSFQPVFKAAPDATGKKLQGFEIYVDRKTGDVEAKPNPPSPAPSSFMLEAVVDDNGTGSPLIPNAVIRVHVHVGVTNVWLTPGKLTIRRLKVAGEEENTRCRFTVRAQFDDGTVGDITESGQLTFTPANWFAGSVIRIPASAGDTVLDRAVSVKTSAKLGNMQAQGKLDILPSWAREPNPPKVELIDGAPDVWDGTLKPERVPNVVFISSGFIDDDREAFAAITNKIVHEMKRSLVLQPFGYLSTSMNYWRVFIPSRERGISIRPEVQPNLRQGLMFASFIPTPVEPPPAAIDWQTQHVLYMAGLPVPADLALVKDITDPANPQPVPDAETLRHHNALTLDFSALRQKWIKTMRLDNPDAMVNGIVHDWLQDWLGLCDRTFIDEVDNFPAMSIGEPPGATLRFPDMLGVHDLRTWFHQDSDAWTALFKRVSAAPRNGVTVTLDDSASQAPEVGNLWAEVRPGFAFDNRNHAAILCNFPFGRANASIYARLGITAKPPQGDKFGIYAIPVKRDPARNALQLDLPAFDIENLRPYTWQTFAHELAHTFGLGDEYAEDSTSFTGTEADLDIWANLTAFPTVLDPNVDPNDPTAPRTVRFDQIKWNWHRIRNACTLARPLGMRPGGLYLAFVRKGLAAFQVAKGDAVRLRQRDTRKVIAKDPVTSNVEFVVDSVSADDLDPPHSPVIMTIVLKNESIGINVDRFGAGSIMYMPIPAPAPSDPVLHPYLTLVAPGGERLMNKIGSTMLGAVCDPSAPGGTQVPALGEHGDPDGKIAADDLPGVVGVYYGGRLHACGILHPTGHCMMRDSSDDASRFCPVCRYALVDRIDPDQHLWIDREYEKKYPYE